MKTRAPTAEEIECGQRLADLLEFGSPEGLELLTCPEVNDIISADSAKRVELDIKAEQVAKHFEGRTTSIDTVWLHVNDAFCKGELNPPDPSELTKSILDILCQMHSVDIDNKNKLCRFSEEL